MVSLSNQERIERGHPFSGSAGLLHVEGKPLRPIVGVRLQPHNLRVLRQHRLLLWRDVMVLQ